MKKLIVCIAMVGASLAAHAQDSNWRFVGGLGAASGGEKITSGDITVIGTTQVVPYSVGPGEGIQKRIGFDYRVASRFTLQATIGHMSSEPSGVNGSYDFTVVPAEFMGFVDLPYGLRLGAGLRKSSAELRGKGVVENSPVNGTFKSDGGAVVELQYMFSGADKPKGPQFGISLRAVSEKFKHTLGELNGDHKEIGVVLYY
ncbi:MAG: hypothetical protein H7Y28_00615 [Rhodoferax sp.]|nr:hypothetical protein [Rhodoferax sp.]